MDARQLWLEAQELADGIYQYGLTAYNNDHAEAVHYAYTHANMLAQNHRCAMYHYNALLLCAECNTGRGEDWLAEHDPTEWSNLGDHACAVAAATIYVAINHAIDMIDQQHSHPHQTTTQREV